MIQANSESNVDKIYFAANVGAATIQALASTKGRGFGATFAGIDKPIHIVGTGVSYWLGQLKAGVTHASSS
jgi:hypothetical protein